MAGRVTLLCTSTLYNTMDELSSHWNRNLTDPGFVVCCLDIYKLKSYLYFRHIHWLKGLEKLSILAPWVVVGREYILHIHTHIRIVKAGWLLSPTPEDESHTPTELEQCVTLFINLLQIPWMNCRRHGLSESGLHS